MSGVRPGRPERSDAVRTRWWSGDRNVVVLLVARTAMSAARAMTAVVTALYLAAQGFSGVRLGELFLCVALASAAMTAAIGVIADRVGNKVFLIVVPLVTAAAAIVFGWSRSVPVLFVFAALGSFGRGGGAGGGSVGPYRPAEAALASSSVAPARRNTLFGHLSFASTLGALAGGLLASLARPGNATGSAATAAYRPAFVAIAVLAALAGLAATGLREPRVPRRPGRSRGERRRGVVSRSWPMLWRFWITNSINGVAMGVGPFISYWFARRYGVGPAEIGVLFAIVNAATLISVLAAAPIARKVGTVRTIVIMRAASGVLLVPMAFAPSFAAAGAVYLVRMLAQRVGLPLRQSFVQGVADPREQASMAGLSTLPAQGTQAGSQVLVGYLFDEAGLAVPFELAAVFQVLNAAAYHVLFGGVRASGERARSADRPAVEEPAAAGDLPRRP